MNTMHTVLEAQWCSMPQGNLSFPWLQRSCSEIHYPPKTIKACSKINIYKTSPVFTSRSAIGPIYEQSFSFQVDRRSNQSKISTHADSEVQSNWAKSVSFTKGSLHPSRSRPAIWVEITCIKVDLHPKSELAELTGSSPTDTQLGFHLDGEYY